MNLANVHKLLFLVSSTTLSSLFIISLFSTTPVAAFSVTLENPGFESPDDFNDDEGWEGTGDTDIQDDTFQIDPSEGNSQALITTSRNTINDDFDTSVSTFNYSDINPVTATVDDGADALQDFLSIPTGSLSIKRNNSSNDDLFRTPKEGSGIYQDFNFTITPQDVFDGKNIVQISFNWSYLTNDATDADLGDQDFGFFTVFDQTSNLNSRSINVLDNSSGNIATPLSSGTTNFQSVNTTFYNQNNLYTYQTSVLPAGTYNYRIGFGVVDVDGLDRSSALLIDNFDVQEIPWEFSPGFGLMLMTGFFGINYYHRCQSR